MFPNIIKLDHFLYNEAYTREQRESFRIKLVQFGIIHLGLMHKIQNNIYAMLELIPMESIQNFLLGITFVCDNCVYKITNIDKNARPPFQFNLETFIYFTLEEYMDGNIKKLLEKLRNIKEHLAVCTDVMEEGGSLELANKFRQYANKIQLEDLVCSVRLEDLRAMPYTDYPRAHKAVKK